MRSSVAREASAEIDEVGPSLTSAVGGAGDDTGDGPRLGLVAAAWHATKSTRRGTMASRRTIPRDGASGIAAVVRAPPCDSFRAARAGRPAGRPSGRLRGAVWRWRCVEPGDDLRRPRWVLAGLHDRRAVRPASPAGPFGLARVRVAAHHRRT